MNVRKVTPSKFSMKFLMDGNVLLVECPGREAQLFMPVLKGNGIIMKNIIFVNKSGSNSPTKSVNKLPKTPLNVLMSANSHGGSDKVNAESSSMNNPMKAITFRCLRNELFDECRKAGGKASDKNSTLFPPRRIFPKVFRSGSMQPPKTRITAKQIASGSSHLKKLRGPIKTNSKLKKIAPTYDVLRGTFRLGGNYLKSSTVPKHKPLKNRVEKKSK